MTWLRKIGDLLFGIPPLEKRPRKNFFLNHFAVGGYDPQSVESYILYKSFMLSFLVALVATFIYYIPIGFEISPNIWGLRLERPVEYFRDDFPRRLLPPLIVITCLYALSLAYFSQRQHSWRFSEMRPIYLISITQMKVRRFGYLRLLSLHTLLPLIIFFFLYNIHLSLDALNEYRLVRMSNDFDAQTQKNFIVIAAIYNFILPACIANFFVFLLMLVLEIRHNPHSLLKTIFKGENRHG